MKICYISDCSIHVRRWVTYFANAGHQIHIITNRPETIPEVKIHPFDFRLRENPLVLIKKLQRFRNLIVEVINPDILHSHYVDLYGYWGAFSRFHPFVITCWGTDALINPFKSKIDHILTRYALKKADFVTSESEYLRRTILGLGVSSDRVRIIQWGVDLAKFNPDVDSQLIKNNLHLKHYKVIISNRHFRPGYNIDVIIMAFKLVFQELPNTKLILIAGHSDQPSFLRNIVKDLGLKSSTVIKDFVKPSEMPFYLNSASIFVSIPSSDSLSISLCEAMACGVAPIVSDIPANKEIIKDSWNGYIVPVRDHIALANAIIKLLQDDKTHELFRRRNLKLVKEKYDHDKHMEKMESLYKSLIKKT